MSGDGTAIGSGVSCIRTSKPRYKKRFCCRDPSPTEVSNLPRCTDFVHCNCQKEGSKSLKCDKRDGKCQCKAYIVGDKCDKCADGFYDFPNCQCMFLPIFLPIYYVLRTWKTFNVTFWVQTSIFEIKILKEVIFFKLHFLVPKIIKKLDIWVAYEILVLKIKVCTHEVTLNVFKALRT